MNKIQSFWEMYMAHSEMSCNQKCWEKLEQDSENNSTILKHPWSFPNTIDISGTF